MRVGVDKNIKNVFLRCGTIGWLVGLLCSSVSYAVAAEATQLESAATTDSADGETLPLQPTRTIAFNTNSVTWLSLDISKDGKQLVLEILGDLYLLPVSGGTAVPLTSGMAMDSQPRFSPDGEQIVFVSDRNGADNLWLINTDGSSLRRLTSGDSRLEFASPSWAPDGDHVIASRSTWGLRTFELWAYHLDGGRGVRIAKSKAKKDTPAKQRANYLGAVYSANGRYLYYARKKGGFAYNVQLPQWQIARRDLRDDSETILTAAPGSAFRPQLSPDGRLLTYATRTDDRTVLRARNLDTGADTPLSDQLEGDDQESRFTRDLLPGYAFGPDGRYLYFSSEGAPARLEIATGALSKLPFTAPISQGAGPLTRFSQRLGTGPVKARVLRQPQLSPDGQTLVFSAFMQIYRFSLASGQLRALTPPQQQAFYPSVAPDGRSVAYTTWSHDGGHIYRVGLAGGKPRRLSEQPAHYSELSYSPDGTRLVAIRASAHERLLREHDNGNPVGAEVVWLPARGGQATRIVPATGLSRPHFGADAERVYLNKTNGNTTRSVTGGLISVRFDGTDLRQELSVTGPGIYLTEDDVQVGSITVAPDGRHLLVQHANQLYLSARINPWLAKQKLKLTSAELPAVRLTSVGADSVGFSADGSSVYWVTGHTLYRRALSDITFPDPFASKDAAKPDDPRGRDFSRFRALEDDASVQNWPIGVYRPRYEPQGSLVLEGATLIPMAVDIDDTAVIENSVVVIKGSRIVAVGERGTIPVPDEATRIDVSGQYLLPGFIDTHSHFRPLRGAMDANNPSLQANLAYGVTTGLDVQPNSLDILSYEEAIDAGMMLGPRALSTGPGIFSNNRFDSLEAAYHVLKRYRDHYGLRNLKAYIAGDRRQRQWIVQAAQALKMMPTTEGALDMKLNITHVIDGFNGNEHNLPLTTLYDDVVQFVARSKLGYTPTLLVLYGGPWAENYYYSRQSPARDAKLRRFTPKAHLDRRTQRRASWVSDAQQRFSQVAAQAHKIVNAGGLVGVGSHGQLQGLGYHWELWALASGGFDNLQALRAATIDGARIIGVAEDLGSVEVGKLADLVVLTEDPREDLRATTALSRVIKGGVVYDAQTLDRQWPEQKTQPRTWWQPEQEPQP